MFIMKSKFALFTHLVHVPDLIVHNTSMHGIPSLKMFIVKLLLKCNNINLNYFPFKLMATEAIA